MLNIDHKSYRALLAQRAAKKRINHQFQLIGLEIAVILGDLAHKSLYMKYAKEYGSDRMLALAKDVAERRDVDHKAAYFMRVLENMRNDEEIKIRK